MAKPKVTATTHELPFEKLGWRDFERMCLWLVRREGYPTAEHHGAGGGDHGRDLVAPLEGSLAAFQCKRTKECGPADAEKAVQRILAEGKRPTEIILLVAADVTVATREKAAKAAGEIPTKVWAQTELDERVKRHPDILKEFFQQPCPEDLQRAHRLQSLFEWVGAQWSRFYGFRRRYYKRLRARHQTFNIQGIQTRGAFAIELEQVFVNLKVAPQSLQDLSPELLRAEGLTGKRDIWELLVSRHNAFKCLAVIGPPGSGKTTLLQHLALVFAGNQQRQHEKRCPALVPILLFLRQHIGEITAAEAPTLSDLVTALEASDGHEPPKGWFDGILQKGKALVLLDGLDEVAEADTRRQVIEWVSSQTRRYGESRFLVTSRPHGYMANPLPTATIVEVQPFTLEQAEHFVDSWFDAYKAVQIGKHKPKIRQDMKARDLKEQVRNSPALAALVVNPLLLTMVVMVYQHRKRLPRGRFELYAEIVNVLLAQWQEAKKLALKLTPAQSHSVLQQLAYRLIADKRQQITAVEAAEILDTDEMDLVKHLRAIQEGSGLILEQGAGTYSFTHLTFQEYFAAAYLVKDQDPAPLLSNIHDFWWREAIRLYATQADPTPIIRACLDAPERQALALAYECLSENDSVDSEVAELVQQKVIDGLESPDSEWREQAAEVLLELRLRNLIRLSATVEIDTSYVSCAEYQLFIDEKRAMGEYLQPDHWRTTQFTEGESLRPIVGVRRFDASLFCQWLTDRASTGDKTKHRFRLPTFIEAESYTIRAVDLGDRFDSLRTDSVGTWVAGTEPRLVGLANELVGQNLQAVKRAFYRALDPDRDSGAHALDFARDRLLRAFGIDSDFELNRAFDLDRALHLARYQTRAIRGTLEHVRDALDQVLVYLPSFARTYTNSLHHHTLEHAPHAEGLVRALDHALESALDRDRALPHAGSRPLRRARGLTLDLARALRALEREGSLGISLDPDFFSAYGVYLIVVLFSDRMEGKTPVREGIRIVRERIL